MLQLGFGVAGTYDPHKTIQDQTAKKPIWSVEYYSKFFDVDTAQVMERCMASVIPKENFLDVMSGSPDLYGMLTFAFSAIYMYAFLVPALIWGATKYFGCQPDLLEMLALYGYGLTIWIPIAFLNILPWDALRWILVLVGSVVSGVFLVRNLYPVLSRAEAQTSKIILILVIILHGALALVLKYKFFAYNAVIAPGNPTPPGTDASIVLPGTP
ncbi:hypothetical protein BGZ65_009541 [Modicella reniformis]|uniref:Protein YIP n=1 Tax=Modicella reniformis TaxID=1440133 RepID=A0A9P6SRZ7_9FUNG|nr:hypothetical protein BGZ65_009541 [Modicella reniformis]